ncbi:MAG: RNA-binding protein [Firmicutes bacterium]|nr:RNA-binding protein [Bacillota bacterium]
MNVLYTKGQVVFSKSGRDKGLAFIVVDFDDNYVYLADGKLRKLEKPKKKKKIHIQITKYTDTAVNHKLNNGEYLLDADIRKAIKTYLDDRYKGGDVNAKSL